jgi:hypothetical protein
VIFVAVIGVELDLRGQVGLGVDLAIHVQRRQLRVTQVAGQVRVIHAASDRLLVVPVRQHVLSALAHDDRRTGVLTHRQDAARSDVGVLEQIERHEAIVRRCLGIVQDATQLREVPGPQEMRDVAHGLCGEPAQRLGRHLQKVLAEGAFHLHVVAREQPVGRGVLSERKQISVLKCVGHMASWLFGLRQTSPACTGCKRRSQGQIGPSDGLSGPTPQDMLNGSFQVSVDAVPRSCEERPP